MKNSLQLLILTALLAASTISSAAIADPWADNVVNYDTGPGGVGAGYYNPGAALGSPTRDSADTGYGSNPITPYSPAFHSSKVVSIGEGGHLTISFDEPVTDDPNNPFGIDLLIFGNSFLSIGGTWPYPASALNTGISTDGGLIEISENGTDWVNVTGLIADGYFPTNGYADATTHFPSSGTILADFLKPVDPTFDPVGKTALETYAGYAGSGGGVGIDISAYGNGSLSEISYVRISNPMGSGVIPEIDGFADVRSVPEPSALLLMLLAAIPFVKRRS